MASVPVSPPLTQIPSNPPPSIAPALPVDSHGLENQPKDNGKKQKKKKRQPKPKRPDSDDSYSSRSWASKEQWSFLTSKLSDYREAARNKKHNQFYQEMTTEWQRQGWKYEECGNKKLPELKLGEERQYAKELRKRAHDAIKVWFKNRALTDTRPRSGAKVLKEFSDNHGRHRRKLQEVEGYSHLYFEDPERGLKSECDARFADYKSSLKENEKPMRAVTHRMLVLRERLEKEPIEIRERVRKYIENASSRRYDEKSEYSNYPEEEQTRLAAALAARRQVDNIHYLSSAFLDSIYKATRYRGVLFLVGPNYHDDGDKCHIHVSSKGSTPGSQLTINKYSLHFDKFKASVEAWGQQCMTDEDIEFFSLKPRVSPISPSDSFDVVEATASYIKDNEISKTNRDDDSDNISEAESLGAENAADESKDVHDNVGMSKGTNISGNYNADEETTLSNLISMDFERGVDNLMPTDRMVMGPTTQGGYGLENFLQPPFDPSEMWEVSPFPNTNMHSTSFHALGAVQFPPMASESYINPGFLYAPSLNVPAPTVPMLSDTLIEQTPSDSPDPPLLQDTPTAFELELPAPQHPAQHIQSSPPQPDIPLPASSPGARETILASKNVNETENIAPRKKGNKRQKVVVKKTSGDPEWCKETSKSLRDVLKGPKEAECVERWETIEEVLGYQGQSRKGVDNLPPWGSAPECLKAYMTSGLYRVDDYTEDDELRKKDLEETTDYFKLYWLALQPAWRQGSGVWPPSRTCASESDWTPLKKGGPGGLVVVLKFLAFWISLRWFNDEAAPYDVALEDVHWVFGEILKQENGGSVLRKRRPKATRPHA